MGGKKSNHIRKFLGSFKAVRNWQLFLILVPLAFLAATLLRLDHLKMAEFRSAVLEADKANNLEGIERGLTELKDFTFSHIVVNIRENNGVQQLSFGTGPFYLEKQYRLAADAAVAKAQETLADDSNPHGNIYAAVAAICQPQAIAHGWAWSSPGYINCWTSELAKYPESDLTSNQIVAAIPSTELYRYEYASPVWAPTPAGFVVLICAILALVIVVRMLIWLVLQIALIILDRKK